MMTSVILLDEVSDVHRHLIDLCGVVLLDVAEDPNIVILHEVDGDTFPTKSSRTTDAVDVQLTRERDRDRQREGGREIR
jgi:hypothetical protein